MRRISMVLFAAMVTTTVVSTGGASQPAAALPAGFTDVVVANVNGPTAVEALPDGRVIVLEQSGAIRRIDATDPADPEVTTVGRLNVCSNSERGLLGFTPDPDYFTSGFVYVYYTLASGQPGGCHNRVSRFVMNEAGLDLGSEFVLVDNISSNAGNHNGGDIEIGNDGHLYIAIGDAGRDPRNDSGSAGTNDAAQDLSLLNGKILRVERSTGRAVEGNPFTAPGSGGVECRLRGNTPETPTTPCREIFASGLRNPYRFAFDPNTSATRFFINDVGQNTREEVNDGQINANYGWPEREGQCPQGENPPCDGPRFGLTDPITDYGHDRGLFITGGTFIPNGVWPAEYDGGYLFADGAFGDIWLRDAAGIVDYDSPVIDASRPTDMTFVHGPNGAALWYVQQNGEVHRVSAPLPVADDDSGPLRYQPLDRMDRRFDSRQQSPAAPLRAGQTRLLDVDAPADAVAALVNITLVRPSVSGSFVTAWEPRTSRPTTSNVNAPPGSNVGNSSIVPLNANGELMLYTSVTTGVVVDVAGFFFDAPTDVASGRFVALTPARLVDTREPRSETNEFNGIDSSDDLRVPIAGKLGIPDDVGEISAVAIVIAGINNESSAGGFATAFPSGGEFPLASSVNVNGDNDVRANLGILPVGATDGSIDIMVQGIDNLTIDVAGYFTGESSEVAGAGRFHLSAPTREYDSRTGEGPAGLGLSGTGTINPTVPDDASAIAQNLTLAPSRGRGFVTAYPGDPLPTVSSINASGPGQVRGALGFVTLADDGTERIFASADNGLVIDRFGWFE
jgi:glucose/arabinose dehydrogenase